MTHSIQRSYIIINTICLTLIFLISGSSTLIAQVGSKKSSQSDTTAPVTVDTLKTVITDSSESLAKDSFFLLKSKGLLGRLAKSIITDTGTNNNLQRIDKLYARYKGRIIRNIEIRNVDFGVPINDTTRNFKNTLTRMADALHKTTRERIIRNNLFFQQGDTLLPILLADNERHLRDQPYIGDANIIVKRVLGTRDSVDVIVLTKDVLSIGGSLEMHALNKIEASVREDNFLGLGDRLQFSGLYDQTRRTPFGYGSEYIRRNIGGSFADAYFGFLNFASTLNTQDRQESTVYARILKPLVNPYMKWTYAFDAAFHKTSNMYFPDTFYISDNRYQYYNVDAWVGLNRSAKQFNSAINDDRLRTLIGVRFLHQSFQQVPQKYDTTYFYQFANITGILGSISLFRQDFYKTQYIYGFGRTEDVPEGLNLSVTTGWTNKQQRVRPYIGLDLQVNYFSHKQNYFNYTLRFGGYTYRKAYEDLSILANLEYFSRLHTLSQRWKQRTFITVGITSQFNPVLNEPLLLESQYGLQEYENIHLGGDHRLTVKAESVFFNRWSFFSFKFAPFVFGNASLLTPHEASLDQTKLYNSIGAGIRSRNESLVFGTLELRTYYFPGKNFNGDTFRVEFNSNIKFKYNNQLIRRPEFILVN